MYVTPSGEFLLCQKYVPLHPPPRAQTYTSDIRGAGTDSNVTIQMRGTSDHTGLLKLENKSKNLFERNQVDEFSLESPDLVRAPPIRRALSIFFGCFFPRRTTTVGLKPMPPRCGPSLSRNLSCQSVPLSGRVCS